MDSMEQHPRTTRQLIRVITRANRYLILLALPRILWKWRRQFHEWSCHVITNLDSKVSSWVFREWK